jgi:DNA sulfur modification protein DndB
MLTPSFEYVLPVIRGIQAGREYYVSMCPVRFIPKLFPLDDGEILPEMRTTRVRLSVRVACA